MKEIFLEMAQDYERDMQKVIAQIYTFEDIYKHNKKQVIHNIAKETLKKLYEERDSYAAKAKFYRKLHKKYQGCEGLST